MKLKPSVHTTQQKLTDTYTRGQQLAESSLVRYGITSIGGVSFGSSRLVDNTQATFDPVIETCIYSASSNSFLRPSISEELPMLFRSLHMRDFPEASRYWQGAVESSSSELGPIALGWHPGVYAANFDNWNPLDDSDPANRMLTIEFSNVFSGSANSDYVVDEWFKSIPNPTVSEQLLWSAWSGSTLVYSLGRPQGTNDLRLYAYNSSLVPNTISLTWENVWPGDNNFHQVRLAARWDGVAEYAYTIYIDGRLQKTLTSAVWPDLQTSDLSIRFVRTQGYVAEFRYAVGFAGNYDVWDDWRAVIPGGIEPNYETTPVYLTSLLGYGDKEVINSETRYLQNLGYMRSAPMTWSGYNSSSLDFDYPSLPVSTSMLDQLVVYGVNSGSMGYILLDPVEYPNASLWRRSNQLSVMTVPLLGARGLNSLYWASARTSSGSQGTTIYMWIHDNILWMSYEQPSNADLASTGSARIGHVVENAIVFDDDVIFNSFDEDNENTVLNFGLERRVQTIYLEYEYPYMLNGTRREDIYEWDDNNKVNSKLPITEIYGFKEGNKTPVATVTTGEPIEKTVAQRLKLRTKLDI